MGCAKGLTILFSVLVLIKGLAGLLIAILGLTSIFGLALLSLVILGFTFGVQSVSSEELFLDASTFLTAGTLVYVFIALGGIGLFVGIWGIVAAAKKNRCMLSTGAVVLFLLLAGEVIITVFTGLGYASFSSKLTIAEFEKSPGGIKGTDYMNTAQEQYKCCGIEGPGDYGILPTDIPASCCIAASGVIDTIRCQAKEEGYIYMDGCGQYNKQIATPFWTPLGVMIGVSAITLFTFIITIAFCCTMRKDEYA